MHLAILALTIMYGACMGLALNRRLIPRASRYLTSSSSSSSLPMKNDVSLNEVLITHPDCHLIGPFTSLAKLRPFMTIIKDKKHCRETGTWSKHCGEFNMDTCMIEGIWQGKQHHHTTTAVAAATTTNDVDELAKKWNQMLLNREIFLSGKVEVEQDLPFGQQGKKDLNFRLELNHAIAVVQQAAFMSRSMQKNLLSGRGSVSKDDKSPVTVADFAVQALIIDRLAKHFPEDSFIAEESTGILREDINIKQQVLEALNQASGPGLGPDGYWDESRLFAAIDRGDYALVRDENYKEKEEEEEEEKIIYNNNNGGSSKKQQERVWVLDPIDGTKGFMRGQHFCIALALMIDGVPVLSTMAVPNLSLHAVVESGATTAGGDIIKVDEGYYFNINDDKRVHRHLPSTGSLYFASTNEGAFARSLGQPLGAAIEVTVSATEPSKNSNSNSNSNIRLCEGAESGHTDQITTAKAKENLGSPPSFIQMDGMGKSCIVGAGGADAVIRLPPNGYQEAIWDHAAACHFVCEAGGKATDLDGKDLDFRYGRLLQKKVKGIVISNTRLHDTILEAIKKARS